MQEKRDNSLMFDVIERMDYMVRVMDDRSNIIYMNQRMRQKFGDKRGKKCYELLSNDGKCINCISAGCKMSENAEAKDVRIGDRVFRIIASPVSLDKSEKFSVEIFEDITEQTKIMEENLRHYEKLKEDVEFAKQIQIKALPEDADYWGMLRIESCYKPSEALGGDTFDVIRIDDNRSLFYIADVSGHGIRASLLTIFLRQIVRGMKEEAGDLKQILVELFANYHDLNMGNEQYFSILLALYSREERTVSFINAGHNCLPLLVKKEGERQEILVTGLPVCGLVAKINHEQSTVTVSHGDRIILYTDGVTEAYNKEKKQSFDLKGLLSSIDSYEQRDEKNLAEHIVEEASHFVEGKVADDMAAVVIGIL